MSAFLRNPWLRPVLENKLGAAVHDLESYVPGTHAQISNLLISPDRVEIAIEKKQQSQVIGEVLSLIYPFHCTRLLIRFRLSVKMSFIKH